MPEPIVSLDAIQLRAQRAVESGQPIHPFQAWPVGTAAGQLFQREVQHLQALRAVHSQQEPSHVHL